MISTKIWSLIGRMIARMVIGITAQDKAAAGLSIETTLALDRTAD